MNCWGQRDTHSGHMVSVEGQQMISESSVQPKGSLRKYPLCELWSWVVPSRPYEVRESERKLLFASMFLQVNIVGTSNPEREEVCVFVSVSSTEKEGKQKGGMI